MPIEVEAVSKEAFAEWVKKAKEEFASSDRPAVDLAKTDRTIRQRSDVPK
jgi:heme/copper-type cytochrome/quinol oxidase subunit 2